ncbi:tRNA-His guanylyltransferase, variant 2 [Sarracenia purpurea var. burkii]
MANSKYEYVKSFEIEDEVMPPNLIVVRIEGRNFHRFSAIHELEKPNDENALNLMNSCATAILEEYPDIVFSYGFSDEYSFVLKKDSQFYQRHASGIVSVVVSFFSSIYAIKWKDFFPNKELKYPPCFDGRAVCYPSTEILRDYLAWRQVDCHINNQYNTCFWMLVKSGKSKRDAQDYLKGTRAQEKNELLAQKFSIDYHTLPVMFRQGSAVFWDKEDETDMYIDRPQEKSHKEIVVKHCNIIEQSFWKAHPSILDEPRCAMNPLVGFSLV